MGEIINVDISRCGSLPPQVGGKLKGYLVMKVDEILWCRKAPENIVVLSQWWGETKAASFKPVNVKTLTNGSQEETTYYYKVMTNIKLFECYLIDCNTLDLVVIDQHSKTLIGSVIVCNLSNIVHENPYQSYFPVINSFGNRIADLHVCFNLKLSPTSFLVSETNTGVTSDNIGTANKMGIYRITKNTKDSKSNQGKRHKHGQIKHSKHYNSPNKSRILPNPVRGSISELSLPISGGVSDQAISQILERGQRLRNAMVKSVLDDGVEMAMLNINNNGSTHLATSSSKRSEVPQDNSTKPEARLMEYLLGKDLDSQEEELALHTLRTISPVASFVEIAQQIFADEGRREDNQQVESNTTLSQGKVTQATEGTTTNLAVSSGGSDENLWEHVQKERPSLKFSQTSRKNNFEAQRKPTSDKSELIGRAKFLRISVQRLSLNFAGIQRVLLCAGVLSRLNRKLAPPSGVAYFVEYELPRPLTASTVNSKDSRPRPWATKLRRFCSKKQVGRVVHFDEQSIHPLAWGKPAFQEILEYSSVTFRVYSRYLNQRLPALLGEVDLPLAGLLEENSLSRTQELSIVQRLGASKRLAPLGVLRVKLELGFDRTHFGPRALKSSDSGDSTEEDSGEPTNQVTTSSEPSSQVEDQVKKQKHVTTRDRSTEQEKKQDHLRRDISAEPLQPDGQKAVLLHGLLHVSEGRGFSSTGTYLVCRAFWREDAMSSEVCWHSDRPYYGFHELMPVLLTPDLLQRSHNNFLVTELWATDGLLGLAKLPLNQFYVAFRDPLVAEKVMLNKYPVVSMDGWVNVMDPSCRQLVGQLNVVLALGTEEQIQLLETTRGLRDAVFTPTFPHTPPPTARDPVPSLWQAPVPHTSAPQPQQLPSTITVPCSDLEVSSYKPTEPFSHNHPSQIPWKSSVVTRENVMNTTQHGFIHPTNSQEPTPRFQNINHTIRADGYQQRNIRTTQVENQNVTSRLMQSIPEVKALDLSQANKGVQYSLPLSSQQTQAVSRGPLREIVDYSDGSSSSNGIFIPRQTTTTRPHFQTMSSENRESPNVRFTMHPESYQYETCGMPDPHIYATNQENNVLPSEGNQRQHSRSQVSEGRNVQSLPGRAERDFELKDTAADMENFMDLIQDLNTGSDIPSSFPKQTNMTSHIRASENERNYQAERRDNDQIRGHIDSGSTRPAINLAQSLNEPLRMGGGGEALQSKKVDDILTLKSTYPNSLPHSENPAELCRMCSNGSILDNSKNGSTKTKSVSQNEQTIVSDLGENHLQDGFRAHQEKVNLLRHHFRKMEDTTKGKSTTNGGIPSLNTAQKQCKDISHAQQRQVNQQVPESTMSSELRTLAVASTQTETGLRDSFCVRVEVVGALHLPWVKMGGQPRKPSCYVTFQTHQDSPNELKITPVVKEDVDPTWEWTCETNLPAQLLQNDSRRFIFKVWHHVDLTQDQPDVVRDAVLGFAAVDLSVLLFGMPWIAGWFNVTDFTGRCKGQIKINVTPLEKLSRFANMSTGPSQGVKGHYLGKTDSVHNAGVAQVPQQPSQLSKTQCHLGETSHQQVLSRTVSGCIQHSIAGASGDNGNDSSCETAAGAKQSCQQPVSTRHVTVSRQPSMSGEPQMRTYEEDLVHQPGKSIPSSRSEVMTQDSTSRLDQHITNPFTADGDPGVIEDEFADVSSSFLSRALKQKLSELDEITLRLKRRLNTVTSVDDIPVLCNPWLEEETCSFNPVDNCGLKTVSPLNSVSKTCDNNDTCKDVSIEGTKTSKYADTSHKQQVEWCSRSLTSKNNTKSSGSANKMCQGDRNTVRHLQEEMTSLHIDPHQEESVEDFDALTDYLMQMAAKEIELENVFNPLLFQHLVTSYGDGEHATRRNVLERQLPLYSSYGQMVEVVDLDEESELPTLNVRRNPRSDYAVTEQKAHGMPISDNRATCEVSHHSQDMYMIPSSDRYEDSGVTYLRNSKGKVVSSAEIESNNSTCNFSSDKVRTHRSDRVMAEDRLYNEVNHNSRNSLTDTNSRSEEVAIHCHSNVKSLEVIGNHSLDTCLMTRSDNIISQSSRNRELTSDNNQLYSVRNVTPQAVQVVSEVENRTNSENIQESDKDRTLCPGNDHSLRCESGELRNSVEVCATIGKNNDVTQRVETKSADGLASLYRNYDLIRSTPSGISTAGNELETVEDIVAKQRDSNCKDRLMQYETNRGVAAPSRVSREVSSSSELEFTASTQSSSDSSVQEVRRQAPDGGNPMEDSAKSILKPSDDPDKPVQKGSQGSCKSDSNPRIVSQQRQPVMNLAEIQRIARIFNPQYKERHTTRQSARETVSSTSSSSSEQ